MDEPQTTCQRYSLKISFRVTSSGDMQDEPAHNIPAMPCFISRHQIDTSVSDLDDWETDFLQIPLSFSQVDQHSIR